MLKKLRGRIRLLRLKGEKHVTEQDDMLRKQAVSTKEMEKNLITLATTERVVLIMCLSVLSAVMQTGLDNRRDRK